MSGSVTYPATMDYAVPATKVAVVRDIAVVNFSGVSGTISVVSPGNWFIYKSGVLAVGAYDHWTGNQVVPGGYTIEAGPSASEWFLAVSGYLFDNA
jgi:hypothetical protein